MRKRCSSRLVQKTYSEVRSWRKAARELNLIYGVNLSHRTWRAYSIGQRPIADPKTRAALLLKPRISITFRNKPRVHFSRLLKHMTAEDLQLWHELRKNKRYRAAYRFLVEIYNRK